MPSSSQKSAQSPFQGFLTELMDQGYHSALTLVPLYPQDAIEIFLAPEELVEFRCNTSTPHYLFISPESVIEIVGLLKSHPFIFITYLPGQKELVNSLSSEFDFPPITASIDNSAQINLNEKFNIFVFDHLIKNRFEELRKESSLPEKIENLLGNYIPRCVFC